MRAKLLPGKTDVRSKRVDYHYVQNNSFAHFVRRHARAYTRRLGKLLRYKNELGRDFFELFARNRSYRKPTPFLKDFHFGKLGIFADFLKRIGARELLNESHVHAKPNRFFTRRPGFEILAGRKLRLVRMSGSDDLGDARDTGYLAVGVIKKNPISIGHVLRHEISGLVVANAEPRRSPVLLELVDRIFGGFGFHQPVAHRWKNWCYVSREGYPDNGKNEERE